MKKIVVIEDEEQMRKNIARILEFENFTVYASEDGITGINLIYQNNPDLILCDIALPTLDGFGVLKNLKSSKEHSHISFIFMTAYSEKIRLHAGPKLGFDDCLTKPFTPDELLHSVRLCLKK